VSLAALTHRIKGFNRTELAALAFYALSGILLLVFLPLTGYPPQIGLLGILSLITGWGIFTRRNWASYLVFVLFAAATVFSLWTLAAAGFTNVLVGISMTVYAVLTIVFAVYLLLIRRKP